MRPYIATTALVAFLPPGPRAYGQRLTMPDPTTDHPMTTPLNLPIAYRLVEKGDGNGNDVPTLEGLFLEYDHINDKIEGCWRELETQPYPWLGCPFA